MRKQRKQVLKRVRKGARLQMVMAVIFVFSLVACEGLPFDLDIPWLMPGSGTPTITPTPETVGPTADPSAEVESTPAPPPESLTIWIPPEFDPDGDSQAANLLKTRLQAFSDNNDGITINLRVKDASGPGGLLDALTATSAAAPAALPDLIALQRTDLEAAALKSLVYPLDDLTSITDDTDWYPYARDMALIQGSVFGVPFAGDALALIYQTSKVDSTPSTWEGLFEALQVVAFPADDPQAYFTLVLYQAAGGAVQDNQRRPVLDAEPLTEVFKLYQSGVASGDFSNLLLEYQTENQVWQAYQEGLADGAVVSVSRFLQENPADTSMIPMLPVSDITLSMGSGWVWALATPQAERQALSIKLAEHLVDSAFLSEWNYEINTMPPRPSALEGWEDQSLRSLLSQISVMTVLRPSNDIIASLGPILRDAVIQILQEQVDPAQAAQVAQESLQKP